MTTISTPGYKPCTCNLNYMKERDAPSEEEDSTKETEIEEDQSPAAIAEWCAENNFDKTIKSALKKELFNTPEDGHISF